MNRWVCIFLMVASSLTTEGLRRRFPRPSSFKHLHEDQCGSVVRIDCLGREVRKARLHQRRNAALRLPICVQLTDDQLLKKLKDIGGYNPVYAAINITEAKKFKDPRTFENERPKNEPKPTRVPDCKHHPTPPPTTASPTTTSPTTLRPTSTELPPRITRPTTGRIPKYAHEEEHKEMSTLEKLFKNFDDNEDEEVRKQVKRNTVVNNCWLKGSHVEGSRGSRVHMCSECHVVTHLSGDEIPQYINEVACGHDFSAHSRQPAHDNQCLASAGLCTQKVLRLPAMKRSGYVKHDALSTSNGMEIYVENWAPSTKDIRSGCKCELYNSRADLLKHLDL